MTMALSTARLNLLISRRHMDLFTLRAAHTIHKATAMQRAVKTVKALLNDAPDPHLALLSYRTTPLPWCGLSPAELSQGRRLRSDVPQTKQNLTPQWPYISEFKIKDKEFKAKQKRDFDHRHRVKSLPDIPDNTIVWMNPSDQQPTGRVITRANAPCSYIVDTPTGMVRRNRRQLYTVPDTAPLINAPSPEASREPIMTRSRTGTVINPPNRL